MTDDDFPRVNHWNYRVVHEVVSGVHTFSVREVYYSNKMIPVMVTGSNSPVAPFGESVKEFKYSMERFKRANRKPILHLDEKTQAISQYDRERHGPHPGDLDEVGEPIEWDDYDNVVEAEHG